MIEERSGSTPLSLDSFMGIYLKVSSTLPLPPELHSAVLLRQEQACVARKIPR